MSLARAWRRQLIGASTAALIVPSAMLAALIALALSGAFSQVGVLGQLFVGPSLPAAGSGSGAGADSGSGSAASGFTVASLPVIPGSGSGSSASSGSRARGGAVNQSPARHPVLTASRGTGVAGGAIGGTGGMTQGSDGSGGSGGGSGGSGGGAGASPGSGSTSPQPTPPPQRTPTPVDTVVNTVTPVTQTLPAPAGPVVTQTLQAAGSAADGLLPQTGQAPVVPGTPVAGTVQVP